MKQQKIIAEHSLIQLCLDDQKTLAWALSEDIDQNDSRFGRLHQAIRDHDQYFGCPSKKVH